MSIGSIVSFSMFLGCLMDEALSSSTNIPGGTFALSDPNLASTSAATLESFST